ncbi:hypothetical protein [Streptomyces sp. NPDC017991]|uniref:hypothetical protein n=1 Tax=Streptomyces sp. NPDC017991 TaxID=3365026 RepID=UPI0037A4949E
MSRTTRTHTIAAHLTSGGLTALSLNWDEQQEEKDPGRHERDGFAVRQQHDQTGTLVVVAGAYGPNWLRTLAEVSGRLEQPHLKCTVIAAAPGVGDHEVMVRWATSTELQDSKRARAQAQAPLIALLRQQDAATKAAEERQALEDACQSGLW